MLRRSARQHISSQVHGLLAEPDTTNREHVVSLYDGESRQRARDENAHDQRRLPARDIRAPRRPRPQQDSSSSSSSDEGNDPPPAPSNRPHHYRPHLTNAERREIVQWFEDGVPLRTIARMKRRPYKTITSVVQTWTKENRVDRDYSHVRRQKIYSEDEQKVLVELQLQNAAAQYEDLKTEWKEKTHREHAPSDATVRKWLDKADITTKQLELEPPQRNDPSQIRVRKTYSLKYLTLARSSVVFIDETGFNYDVLHRTRGRSKRGEPAVAYDVRDPRNPGQRLNVCAAVNSRYGLMHYEVRLGSWDADSFAEFISNLCKHHVFQTQSMTLVLDNVKWHFSDVVRDELAMQTYHHTLLGLPSYSPHLNAIEYCFNKWKAPIKQRPDPSMRRPFTTLHEAIDTHAALITPQMVDSCCDHVSKVAIACSLGRPLTRFSYEWIDAPIPDDELVGQ